ncbi:hypothetical protein [Shewanella algae]|uniref:hypothetical protein n=1 Tax=Shewanella algae TaxID=38313 RepID=UPI0011821AB3|nr:hypothetical protein [Shewanella algae]QTE86199.1 hypothetical protein JKK44_19500 [Shewanella algae]TVL11947.1 hypothetical protein AYI82_01670 [Shewanella algae]TVO91487.1 hypothetical protein AYI80_06465 [Shewanella algae]TXS87612.1 hypothetical protein AYI81_05830 [Shewanella algae]HDS1213303.1 hypothetical protein [Shewanella algae]
MDKNEEWRLYCLEASREIREFQVKQVLDEFGLPVLVCNPNDYWDSERFREKMYSIHTVLQNGDEPNLAEVCREGIDANTDHEKLMVAAAIHNQFENNGNYSPEEILKCAQLIFYELGFDGLASKLEILKALQQISMIDVRTQQLKGKRTKTALTDFQKKYLKDYCECRSHTPNVSHNQLVKIVNQQLNVKHDPKTIKNWLSKLNE